MKQTIEVTQYEIDHGVEGACATCPVALALYRHFKLPVESRVILVGSDNFEFVRYRQPELVQMYMLPIKARKWINDFDDDRSNVAPFEFSFEMTKGILARIDELRKILQSPHEYEEV